MYDSESNLYYYRNRIYSPELGRFVSKDPKGYVDGTNLYAYVKNNPIRYLDPMGTSVRSSVANSSMFENIWDSTVSGFTYGFGGDIPTGSKGSNTVVGNIRDEKLENYLGIDKNSNTNFFKVNTIQNNDSGMKFISNYGDEIGLILSTASLVSPPVVALRLGVTALAIDILQPDSVGIITGGVALIYPNKITKIIDFSYGAKQVIDK